MFPLGAIFMGAAPDGDSEANPEAAAGPDASSQDDVLACRGVPGARLLRRAAGGSGPPLCSPCVPSLGKPVSWKCTFEKQH